MHRGYVKLWRKIKEWEWFTDVNTSHLFIYLLITVRREPGQWRGVTLEIGETVESIDTMVERSGLSIQNIRTAIKHLKLTGELTERQHGKHRILKLENFHEYHEGNTEVTRELTVNQQGTNRELTPNKKVKKEEKEEKKKPATKKVFSHQTESLYEYIDELCKKYSIENKVKKQGLEVQIERHREKMTLRVEIQKCFVWLSDNNKRTVSTMRLANWFENARKFQKQNELRKHDREQAQKDPYLKQDMKDRGTY